jgi:hypothetical protein
MFGELAVNLRLIAWRFLLVLYLRILPLQELPI